jgi:hypothetical protein
VGVNSNKSALHSKDYYVAPIYPVLFAAGGVVWESWNQKRRWLTYTYCVILLVSGALLAPMSLPILPPEAFIRYMRAMHIKPSSTQNLEMGPFPSFTAEMFGWPELTAEVARVYDALPPAEQSKVGIFCQNYGEASAINYLGARYRLAFAISGHQNYYLWGPHGYTGEVMIVVGKPEAELREMFSLVEAAGYVNHPAMPFEHVAIYLCRGAKVPLTGIWPQQKLLAVKLAIQREDAVWGVVTGLRAVRRGRICVLFADDMAVFAHSGTILCIALCFNGWGPRGGPGDYDTSG